MRPEGHTIASASVDGTVRLWPVPGGSPFHTRPLRELIETIAHLTNYRILEDDTQPSGYRRETTPFHGWETVPGW